MTGAVDWEWGVIEVDTCRSCEREDSHLMVGRRDGQAEWVECTCCGAVRSARA